MLICLFTRRSQVHLTAAAANDDCDENDNPAVVVAEEVIEAAHINPPSFDIMLCGRKKSVTWVQD